MGPGNGAGSWETQGTATVAFVRPRWTKGGRICRAPVVNDHVPKIQEGEGLGAGAERDVVEPAHAEVEEDAVAGVDGDLGGQEGIDLQPSGHVHATNEDAPDGGPVCSLAENGRGRWGRGALLQPGAASRVTSARACPDAPAEEHQTAGGKTKTGQGLENVTAVHLSGLVLSHHSLHRHNPRINCHL